MLRRMCHSIKFQQVAPPPSSWQPQLSPQISKMLSRYPSFPLLSKSTIPRMVSFMLGLLAVASQLHGAQSFVEDTYEANVEEDGRMEREDGVQDIFWAPGSHSYAWRLDQTSVLPSLHEHKFPFCWVWFLTCAARKIWSNTCFKGSCRHQLIFFLLIQLYFIITTFLQSRNIRKSILTCHEL